MPTPVPVTMTFDIPAVFQIVGNYRDPRKVFPNTLASLDAVARLFETRWKEFSMGAPIPGSSLRINSTGPYTHSIQSDLTKDYEKRVFTDFKYEGIIEDGHPKIDLKEGLLKGAKARLMNGQAYNVVSFHHGATKDSRNAIPSDISSWIRTEFKKAEARQLQTLSSIKVRQGGREVEHPKTHQKRNLDLYSWGFSSGVPPFTGALPRSNSVTGQKWKSGPYTNMYRFNTGVGKAKRSSYQTFRGISERSAAAKPGSWIVPERMGIPIRQRVVESAQREAWALVERGIADDFGLQA